MLAKFFVSILIVAFSLNINICETGTVFVSSPFFYNNGEFDSIVVFFFRSLKHLIFIGEQIIGAFSDYTLFTRNTTKPKSYIVMFKYIAIGRILNNAKLSTNAQVIEMEWKTFNCIHELLILLFIFNHRIHMDGVILGTVSNLIITI